MRTKNRRRHRTKNIRTSRERQLSIPEVGPEREEKVENRLEKNKPETPLRLAEGITWTVCETGVLALRSP